MMTGLHGSPVCLVFGFWVGVTDLFGVEVSILVTVGDGDGEEVIMGAAVRSQPVQRSLELGTTRRLLKINK